MRHHTFFFAFFAKTMRFRGMVLQILVCTKCHDSRSAQFVHCYSNTQCILYFGISNQLILLERILMLILMHRLRNVYLKIYIMLISLKKKNASVLYTVLEQAMHNDMLNVLTNHSLKKMIIKRRIVKLLLLI